MAMYSYIIIKIFKPIFFSVKMYVPNIMLYEIAVPVPTLVHYRQTSILAHSTTLRIFQLHHFLRITSMYKKALIFTG